MPDPEEQGINREIGYGKPPDSSRFRPGQSGNPGGRPKGRSLTALIREALEREQVAPESEGGGSTGKTGAEALAEVIVGRALKGQFLFAKEVLDRTEGKVRQQLDVSATGELFSTVLYLPENGRDGSKPTGPGDPTAAGPAGAVPL